MRKSIGLFFLVVSLVCHGQEDTDTLILSLQDVFALATDYHPVIRQANLQNEFADAELLHAKGQFDPKIQSQYRTKNYKDTEYYSKFYNSLKIPVWFPVDPKVEVYENKGSYLNPENYVSGSDDYWQVTAGISLPLGKGLFIDERRNLVKQAALFSDLAEAEKIKLVNKTLLNISKAYWEWYLAYNKYTLTSRSLQLAENIFERVRLDYRYGELAAIDTIQAQITLLSRQADFEKSALELTQARLLLSTHLWSADNIPLELAPSTVPDNSSQLVIPADSSFQKVITWAAVNHPEIQKLLTKQKQLDIQQQWNKESLKPELNLNYSLINAPFNVSGFETPQWQENYKLGMDFSMPVFLRKERGKIQKTRIYLEQTEFTIIQTRQEIRAELQSTYAALKTNQKLATQYDQMANGYEKLLAAEVFNLESGESDLFKLNIQQDKYIQAQIKALEMLAKVEKLKYQLPFDAGLPFLSYQKMYE